MKSNMLSSLLREKEVKGLLLTNYYSIFYVTGFRGLSPGEREAWVLVLDDSIHLWSDGRYLDADYIRTAREHGIQAHYISPEESLLKQMERMFAEKTRIGFESEDLTWSEYEYFSRIPVFQFVPLSRPLTAARMKKDRRELTSLKRACMATDRCLQEIMPLVRSGQTEQEIAIKIEYWIRSHGYQVAFTPIVATGKHTAIAHYDTVRGKGTVGRDDLLLVDFGVSCDGYNADITRMFVTGKVDSEIIKAYAVLREVQEKTVTRLSLGDEYMQVDNRCRSSVIEEGYFSYPHSTGHGIGLEVHEYPKVSGSSKERIEDGHVFTIEPGIYSSGKWGMRLEDTVAMINGKVEIFTQYPRGLTKLD